MGHSELKSPIIREDEHSSSRRINLYGLLSRIGIWGGLIGILYILSPFSLLIFLTFIFAYIQAEGVERLEGRVTSRPLRVVIVGLLFLGVLISLGFFLVPRIRMQAEGFARNYPTYLMRVDRELLGLSESYSLIKPLLLRSQELERRGITKDNIASYWKIELSPTAGVLQDLLGVGESTMNSASSVQETIHYIANIGGKIIGLASSFLLALLFSFLIVLDLPRLTAGVKALAHSRISFAYLEVADGIVAFASVLGQALQAQVVIALINSLLTAIGVYLLGITEGLAFLSLVVFLCGFIPVAGVFISSVPICLVAIQIHGPMGVLMAGLLIWVIHLIEAYVLNPRIFGKHLKINPVVVLIILTVAGKLFHVWGLVLGLPVCTFIYQYAINPKSENGEHQKG